MWQLLQISTAGKFYIIETHNKQKRFGNQRKRGGYELQRSSCKGSISGALWKYMKGGKPDRWLRKLGDAPCNKQMTETWWTMIHWKTNRNTHDPNWAIRGNNEPLQRVGGSIVLIGFGSLAPIGVGGVGGGGWERSCLAWIRSLNPNVIDVDASMHTSDTLGFNSSLLDSSPSFFVLFSLLWIVTSPIRNFVTTL